MSSGEQVAVLEPLGGIRPGAARPEPLRVKRPLLEASALAALGLYGVLRWGTLLSPAPRARLLGLLVVALVLAGPGRAAAARSRALAVGLVAASVVAALLIAGVPAAWIGHVRIAVTANGIGQGLGVLPHVLVPYAGIENWARVVIVLGAGVLLLDAGAMIMFARRPLTEPWRLGIALPLVVLAVLPSTLARPHSPYLHGLLLFALLALFIWGDRVRRADAPFTIIAIALVGAAAMLGAATLDPHHPWLDYQALAGKLSSPSVERFDWSQHYGPLNWPRTGREILDVRAARPDYWKAQDLDRFDGYGWSAGDTPLGAALPAPDPGTLARFTQTIQVTIRAMQTNDVIGAGFASRPAHLPAPALQGQAPGTWIAPAVLQPGDSYLINTYSPTPTSAQLAGAGAAYPAGALAGYRAIGLPRVAATRPTAVIFAPFHSGQGADGVTGMDSGAGGPLMQASPYARAYRLARRLAAGAPTPYAFVQSVMTFLHHGYVYDENPPRSRYPLASFLFADRRGYCQQFSGAMTLLLRMGGLPARVAAGFTSGSLDSGSHQWIVTDMNAHAWVEVWFPRYGWVRFDPTPAGAPARLSTLPFLTGGGRAAPRHSPVARHRELAAGPVAPAPGGHARGGSSFPLVLVIPLSLVVLTLGAMGVWSRRWRRREDPVAELERAFARCGAPLRDGLTLSRLEQRWRASPQAAAYVRTVRLARYAGAAGAPSTAQRRAVRAELRNGLGAIGWLRAWWALPPRPASAPGVPETPSEGLH